MRWAKDFKIGSDGTNYFLGRLESGVVCVVTDREGSWSTEEIMADTEGEVVHDSAMTIGPGDVLHAVHRMSLATSDNVLTYQGDLLRGGELLVVGYGQFATIAVGAPDTVFILSKDYDRDTSSMNCNLRAQGNWTTETIVTQPVDDYSIAVDNAGRPHVAITGIDGGLWYATRRD
jgi:hypothetical protein